MNEALLLEQVADLNVPKGADIYLFLETYIGKKEQQVLEIEKAVERYEKRRLKEEQTYQSMSGLRRMLSGKKPDHHVAVEYIHYVKKPMELARQLRLEIASARTILEQQKQS